MVKNGPSFYRFRDYLLTLSKTKSVARIQVPFFKVEAKVSMEPPIEILPQDQKLNFIVVDTWRTYKIAFHTCFLYMKAHISYTIF